MSGNTKNEGIFHNLDVRAKEKSEGKKCCTEQLKSDKGDWLLLCDKSQKRLQNEELLKQVQRNQHQCDDG